MQEKLLYDLVEDLTGENNGRIVDILFNKKDVNEFGIAKKMELTINQVRNILYKLSNFGLVSFIRKKDQKKGWYIYYWTLDTTKCLLMLESSLKNKIDNLEKELIERQNKRFYICKSCDIEVTEETALDHDFTCEECAGLYELLDSSNYIKSIQIKITKINKELEQIQVELKDLQEKHERRLKRIAKKEQKLAEEEKERKRLEAKKKREANKLAKEKEKKAKEVKTKVVKKSKEVKTKETKKPKETKIKVVKSPKEKKQVVSKTKKSSTKKELIKKKTSPKKSTIVKEKKSTAKK